MSLDPTDPPNRSRPFFEKIAFNEEESDQLKQVCREAHKTKQDFCLEWIKKGIEAHREEKLRRMKRDRELKDLRGAKKETYRSTPAAPHGLGIRDRLQERSQLQEQDAEVEAPSAKSPVSIVPHAAPQMPQIIINNGPAVAPGTGLNITALAQKVVDAPKSDRKRVLAEICAPLIASRSREECAQIGEQLDAEIKRLMPKTITATVLERVQGRIKR